MNNTSREAPATVSNFRLDRFEVTVGRFRKFVAAWLDGWRPAAGAGKHAHIEAGLGLNVAGGGSEPGWVTTLADLFPTTKTGWDSALSCFSPLYTWTSEPSDRERYPANCANFAEAYAFCIWDGGFLPTEAEWNYAAAGGTEQRVYPWSSPPTATIIDCTYANYSNSYTGMFCVPNGYPQRVGLLSPAGDGRYGHADLGGNVQEWTLDLRSSKYTTPCVDCVDLEPSDQRAARGGWFSILDLYLTASYRAGADDGKMTSANTGIRCARAPL